MSKLIEYSLGEIGKYINGKAFKPHEWKVNGIPIIRIANLNNVNAPIDYFQGELEDEYRISDGDILVSWSATLDAFIWNRGPAALNQHIFKVIPNEKLVNKEFLFFVLKRAMSGLSELVHGATMKHVNKPVFESFRVRIPREINDQRKIAQVLKSQLAEVEKARKAVELQVREVESLGNAIVFNSIRKGKTKEALIGDVLDEVKKGVGDNWHEHLVLGATRNGLALAKEPPGKNPQRYKPVVPGTIFYNPMRIMIGSIAMVDDGDMQGITSPDYVVLKGGEGKVDSRWFYYWLRSPLGKHCINTLARGAVRERMLFNRLADGEIELPDYKVQLKASESLKQLRQLKSTFTQGLKELELIPDKLLKQVFDGFASNN